MTFEGLGEMFEGDSDSVDRGRAEVLAYADPGERTPVYTSRNVFTWLCVVFVCLMSSLLLVLNPAMYSPQGDISLFCLTVPTFFWIIILENYEGSSHQ
jgi:hypothetical protein